MHFHTIECGTSQGVHPVELPIRAEIVTVTPEQAKEWLARRSDRQRRLNEFAIETYARDMAAIDWGLTGDPIKFDTEGQLIDGQHRLAACIKAGVSFTTLVVYGVDPDTFDQTDTGRRRYAREFYKGDNPALVEAIARLRLLKERHGGQYHSDLFTPGGWSDRRVRNQTRLRELRVFMDENAALLDWAAERAVRAGTVFPRRGIYGTVAVDMAAVDPEAEERFTEGVASGANLDVGNPAYTLREQLIKWSSREARPKDRAAFAVALIRAWNAFVRNKKLLQIKSSVSGEDFPQVMLLGKGGDRRSKPPGPESSFGRRAKPMPDSPPIGHWFPDKAPEEQMIKALRPTPETREAVATIAAARELHLEQHATPADE
jgi:hypothetical protein